MSLTLTTHAKDLELLSQVDMFDAGLALINDDDKYDIYTINHNFAESYLLYDSSGFSLKKAIGLSQTRDLPLYEPVGRSPTSLQQGLNIFSPDRNHLLLYCNKCSKETAGEIVVATPRVVTDSVKVVHTMNGEVEVQPFKKDSAEFLKIKFNLKPQGIIVLKPLFPDLVFQYKVSLPSDQIYVGHAGTNPQNSSFTFNTQDNHSSAWAKVNQDNLTDVFMATGGLRARIKEFHPAQIISEQVYSFDRSSQKYTDANDVIKISGIKCRTYKSMWLDFENDGDLDLYQGCLNSPNKLHIQQDVGSGQFIESAEKFELNFRQSDEFKWFDYNQDGLLDFITINRNRLHVYARDLKNSSGKFKLKYKGAILGNKLNSVTVSIKVADLNNDGLLSILVTTADHLFIYDVAQSFKISPVKLSQLALPESIKGHVSINDVNFDGLLDIISFQQGIFLNQGNSKFKLSEAHKDLFIDRKYHFNNLIWFDNENNGNWDVLAAQSYPTKANKKKTQLLNYSFKEMKKWDHLKLFSNLPNINLWLYVDLIGPPFNRDGIGAKIKVTTPNHSQTRQVMGTEDSFHSQGHYRQYFGLGQAKIADIEVIWPDGKVQKISQVNAQQLLKIKYENP
ncbi:CRTAC1 family protein [Marinicella marina]|nr:CRTAC1 family protein [Marinicella marina]